MRAYISLGANIGSRHKNIEKAIELLGESVGTVVAQSAFLETEPWGFDSANAFLNAAIAVETSLSPTDLIDKTEEIEREIGRTSKSDGGAYEDRLIDIDILLYEQLVLHSERLVLPHPLMHKRAFVLIPMVEIAPNTIHPLLNKTMQEIAKEVNMNKEKNDSDFCMIAKTLYGMEEVLAAELTKLGAKNVEANRRMVSYTGDKTLLYKSNFSLRTALRILKPIVSFKAKDADTVYKEVKKVEWDKYLNIDKTFAVEAVIYSEDFNHSKFVAYRTKDAIVDYFMEKKGKRPAVRIKNPDISLHIHISHNDCTLSLDSSGESLHKRGYRVEQTEAPLNEVLAAGMILKSGWEGESNLVDPMCGSGTLLIEAAMIAMNIAPGIYRRQFAFEKWEDFDRDLLDEIYNDETQERQFDFKCYGSDISPAAIEVARKNVQSAGLLKYIELKTQGFQQATEEDAPKPGIIITNPPYGERIAPKDILGLYSMIGERLKHVYSGYQAWILSVREECFEKIGLRPKERVKLVNGSIECEYRCYELFDGKNKEYKKELNEQGKYSSDKEKPSRELREGGSREFKRDFGARGKSSRFDGEKPRRERREDGGKDFKRDFGARGKSSRFDDGSRRERREDGGKDFKREFNSRRKFASSDESKPRHEQRSGRPFQRDFQRKEERAFDPKRKYDTPQRRFAAAHAEENGERRDRKRFDRRDNWDRD